MAQGGVAPGRESRVTGRASKRLDPFGMAMLGTPSRVWMRASVIPKYGHC